MLNREAFLKAAERRFEVLEVRGIGHIRIGSVTGDRWDEWRAAMALHEKPVEMAVQMLIMSAVNEDGGPMFTAADAELLRQMSPMVIGPLSQAIVAFNAPKASPSAGASNSGSV